MKRRTTSSGTAPSKKKKAKPRARSKTEKGRSEITASTAFRRATAESESFANEPERLLKLLQVAREKINHIPRGPFAETWPYLMAMIRLLTGFQKGEYRDISTQNLHLIVATIIYFVSPFDVIPDSVPIFGHLDDALVVRMAVKSVGADLDAFMAWETSKV